MARIAPSWMMTLNAAHLSSSKPSSAVARIRCPVEETGRNSVPPSTMPRISAIRSRGTSAGRGQIDPPSGELAAAVESAEPFVADRGERRRLDAERLQPRRARRRDIVALEHQPLVARQRRARKPAEPGEQAGEEVGHVDDLRVLLRDL